MSYEPSKEPCNPGGRRTLPANSGSGSPDWDRRWAYQFGWLPKLTRIEMVEQTKLGSVALNIYSCPNGCGLLEALFTTGSEEKWCQICGFKYRRVHGRT